MQYQSRLATPTNMFEAVCLMFTTSDAGCGRLSEQDGRVPFSKFRLCEGKIACFVQCCPVWGTHHMGQNTILRPALWYLRTCRLSHKQLCVRWLQPLRWICECISGRAEQPPSFQEDGGHEEQPQAVLNSAFFRAWVRRNVQHRC